MWLTSEYACIGLHYSSLHSPQPIRRDHDYLCLTNMHAFCNLILIYALCRLQTAMNSFLCIHTQPPCSRICPLQPTCSTCTNTYMYILYYVFLFTHWSLTSSFNMLLSYTKLSDLHFSFLLNARYYFSVDTDPAELWKRQNCKLERELSNKERLQIGKVKHLIEENWELGVQTKGKHTQKYVHFKLYTL